MTSNRMQETHPADSELAAWIDEPESRATAVETHVESCSRCRERLADLARTRAALALDPPMPSEAAFAAQRERILEAIDAAPRAGGGRVVRRIAWLVPLAAAATIAAIVLVGRTESPDQPRTADAGAETAPDVEAAAATGQPTLPIFADAREAAEDAAAVIAALASTSEIAAVPSEAFDEDALDATLAAAEPLAPPLSIERSAAIESEFAQLPEEEQSAVLLELASADFDL
ncbi:MAG: anti-sigma factor family protein [Gemmatimonadota bacterium]